MTSEKTKYKIWNWTIEKNAVPLSMNPTGQPQYWYSVCGVSDQYQQGRIVRTSRIVKIDFELGIAETQNSIYELQKEPRDFNGIAWG